MKSRHTNLIIATSLLNLIISGINNNILAQNLNVTKEEVKDISCLNLPENYVEKNNILRGFSTAKKIYKNPTGNKSILLTNKKTTTLGTAEDYIFSSSDKYYTNKIDSKANTIIRYDISGSEINRAKLPPLGYLKFINQDGDFIFLACSEEYQEGYEFYTNELKKVKFYEPYKNNQYSDYDALNNMTAIISKQNNQSKVFKIALFERFELLKEKEFHCTNCFISNIKITNDNIIILLGLLNSENVNRITCFDFNLNLLWEKDFNVGVYDHKLIADESLPNLFVFLKDELLNINTNDGKNVWKVKYTTNLSTHFLQTENLIQNGKFLIINEGIVSEGNNDIINDINLKIIKTDNGGIVYKENLGRASDLKVLSGSNYFILIKDDSVFKYAVK